jgi:hypothetical protein
MFGAMRLGIPSLAAVALLAGCMASPVPRVDAPMRATAAPFSSFPEGGKCLTELGQDHANFTPLPDRYYGAGCSTVGTVQLAGLQGDQAVFAVRGLGPVTCPLAETLAGWARFGVDRAARQILGSPLVRIETMGSYSCRNVIGNTHSSGRRSAHATANAVDVAGFDLADGRRILVTANWNDADPAVRQFLRTVRGSACKRFTTVLSPDYNVAHHDHIHVEVGGGRYCG